MRVWGEKKNPMKHDVGRRRKRRRKGEKKKTQVTKDVRKGKRR